MQLLPLLFKHCFSKHKELRRAIMQISLCFGLLCEKVINKKHIVAAKQTLVEATCVLEKYFPPSFFDISIHLMVHLCDEAFICGPVRYRWMYPFERLMKVFKDYVKNHRYIEGSIAEEYITEEASLFAREYMPNPGNGGFGPCRERFIDECDEFADEEALGKGKRVRLTNIQYEQAARYIFETHEDIDEWRQKYNDSWRNKRRKGESNTLGDFRLWVSNELLRTGDATSRLARLARGPEFYAEEFGRYRVNGFVFSSYTREQNLVGKQNSGISIKALTTCVASSKDKKPKDTELTYYGVVQQILELDYTSFKEVVFYCDWVRVEDSSACMVDIGTKMVMVDLTKLKRKDNMNDEPFVCSFQNIKQERTKGTEEEGLEPNRVNLYLHARKDKTGTFHRSVIDEAEKIKEIRDGQDVASQNDIDLDALNQVHGKDNRGRVRGVGGKVSRTKLKHIKPILCELQQVKNDVKTQNEKMDNMESKMDSVNSQMGTLIGLMQSQDPKKISFPVTGTTEPSQSQQIDNATQKHSSPPNQIHNATQKHSSPPNQIHNATQKRSYPPNQIHNASNSIGTCSYIIKDITNQKPIAIGKIIESPPGTTVHGHELQYPDVKVLVESIFPRMDNEPLHRLGFVKTIGESKNSYVAWPFYLLEKMT